jgi:hypothetical protein
MLNKCLCGRYSNFGTSCTNCAGEMDTGYLMDEDIDLFYLVGKSDRTRLQERLNHTRWGGTFEL